MWLERWRRAGAVLAMGMSVVSCLDPASEPMGPMRGGENVAAGSSADPVIRTLYESRSAAEIARAAGAARGLKDPRVLDALMSTIREGRIGRDGGGGRGGPNTARAVGDALRRLADPRSVEMLVALLVGDGKPADAHVLGLVGSILPALEDPRTVELLTPILGEEIPAERKAAAARVLATSGSERGVMAVADAFTKAQDLGLLRGYADALVASESTMAVDALLARWELATRDDVKVVVLHALGDCSDKRVAPVAIAALREEKSADVRRRAATVVLRVGGAGSWDATRGALSDADASVRAAAVSGLYWGPVVKEHRREVLDVTLKILAEDGDATVRGTAAGALAYQCELAPAACVAALVKALEDRDPWVRQTAARSLGIGRQMIADKGDGLLVVGALKARLQDAAPTVREAAADSLKTFDPQIKGEHAVGQVPSLRRPMMVDEAGRLLEVGGK